VANDKTKTMRPAPPEVVIEFLRKTLPFQELDEAVLKEVARHILIDFFPKGTVLFVQDETEVQYLYIIQKGGVRIYLKDEDGNVTLKDFRGEGSYVGALPLIQGTRANLNVETVEDTFCFLLPKKVFLDLLNSHPPVTQFFLKSFSEKFVKTAYRELRQRNTMPRTEGGLVLFSVKVKEVIRRKTEFIEGARPVQEAAKRMADLHIGSLLVRGPDGDCAGIITDKDLRTKVIAMGRPLSTPVAEIMASPVVTIPAGAVCFEALLVMMREQIHHLAVEGDGQIIGVITAHDIMVLQGTSPLYLFREIVAQQEISGLYPLSQKVPLVIRTLIEEGAKANNITRMITILNDHILDKLLTLLIEEKGSPPAPFCWLLLGSEGRKEQTFRTDQDNALVYVDLEDPLARRTAEEYFAEFAESAIDHLERCGYPRCPGDVMASNPKWRQPFTAWKGYFDRWIDGPDPLEGMHASIFFDFRAGFGDQSLATRLRQHIIDRTDRQQIYLLHMAREALGYRAPLSFFKNFIVEKNGEHKNKLDIKHKGLTPIVNFARILSLKHSIKETNTISRLKALADHGHISSELCSTAAEAYELQMQIRFVHQLHQLESGIQPDNYIDPGQLSDLEKQMLKDAFSVIERLQGVLKSIFPVV